MRTLLAAIAVALAVAGCGDDEEERVEGTGYSYAVPSGWDDVSDEAEDEPSLEFAGVRPDSLVVGEREDGFTTNVNVIREPGLPAAMTARQYARISIAGLRDPVAVGFPQELVDVVEELQPTEISETRPAELGGKEAVAWGYLGRQGERTVRIRQVATVLDRSGYTVTLTATRERFQDELGALDEVADSWRWD
jgi:hypothetical protein